MATTHPLRTLTRPANTICSRLTSQFLPTQTFSTSSSLQVKARERVSQRYGHLPPYPYGYRQWYKKSNFGLFGNARVRFGNNVSERNEIKTRRRWYPNVHRKRLYSVSLGRMVRVKVVARVLRTIDKVGGLDEYLLGDKAGRIKELGPGGWALRWRIMRTDAIRARLAAERERLGLVRSADGRAWVLAEGGAVVNEEVADELAFESGDEGVPEAELKARELAIDRALDEDLAQDDKGIDGGVELENLDAEVDDKPRRRRW